MDPPAESFDALERAFEEFRVQDPTQRVSPSLKRHTTHVQRAVPTTTATIPDSEPDSNDIDEGAVPPSNDNDHDDTNDNITTPLLQQHDLVRHNSGLPPTPPTMANSDIAESRPERSVSLVPLFADRVRNALQSHKSGLSTPVNNLDNHSPPTPEASPGRKENLAVPRPPLKHYPSSYADSFKTANEGLSANGSTSRVHSPAQDFASEKQKTWWERTKPIQMTGLGLGLHNEDTSKPMDYESDRSVVRSRTYAISSPEPDYEPESLRRMRSSSEPFPDFDQNLTEDSEASEAQQKKYPMSSPETGGESDWMKSINPKLIEAALHPEPSPELSPSNSPIKKSSYRRDMTKSEYLAARPGNAHYADSPDAAPALSQLLPAVDDDAPRTREFIWGAIHQRQREAGLRKDRLEQMHKVEERKSKKASTDATPALSQLLPAVDDDPPRRREVDWEAIRKRLRENRLLSMKYDEKRKSKAAPTGYGEEIYQEHVARTKSAYGEPDIARKPEQEREIAHKLEEEVERKRQALFKEVDLGRQQMFAKLSKLDDFRFQEVTEDEDRDETRVKGLKEDSDRGEVRVKNYQMESDSDRDRTRPSSSDGPPSPSWRKSLQHRAAFQKLRKPILPGDDLKRTDEALMYSSTISWKRARISKADLEPAQQLPPRREMDSEFLRAANVADFNTLSSLGEIIPEDSLANGNNDPPPMLKERDINAPQSEESPKRLLEFNATETQVDIPPLPTSADAPALALRKLRDFTTSGPTAEVESPPNTLVTNNRVYAHIQEENAKRHSAVSEGSALKAMLVFPPAVEHKRLLRHAPKRDSLRADNSIAGLSKSNSEESMHTPPLRHQLGVQSITSNHATFAPTTDRPDRRIHTMPIKLRSSADKGFAHSPLGPKKISAMPSDINGGTMKQRMLRRTLRDKTLHRHSLSLDLSTQQEVTAPEAAPSPRLRKFSRVERLDNNFEVRRTSLYSELDNTSQAKSPELRRFSKEERLENNPAVRRTSLGRESQLISHDMDLKLERLANDLTIEGREMRDKTSIKDRRISSEDRNPTSPRRKSFDPRLLNPIGTPLSTSLSERTAVTEAEYGLARGVEIHQHNNDSLLLIHGQPQPPKSHHVSFEDEKHVFDPRGAQRRPTIGFVEPPVESAAEIIGLSMHQVDSPLTNPRAAPDPPVIQFIPPTNSDRSTGSESSEVNRPVLHRGLSWKQKARRFSESLVQPLAVGRKGSFRHRRVATEPEQSAGPAGLKPYWKPRAALPPGTSSSESSSDPGLPPGGDTSQLSDEETAQRRKSFFPRNMSVRMPGLRGSGGFLVGNSLGLDRHGTNNRRHYIAKRTSDEMLRRSRKRNASGFTVPFSGGKRMEYVGLKGCFRTLARHEGAQAGARC